MHIQDKASSSENIHPLLSSHIKIHKHIYLELFSLVNSAWTVHISLLIQTFSLEKAILLIGEALV